jgi:hypothetical protein
MKKSVVFGLVFLGVVMSVGSVEAQPIKIRVISRLPGRWLCTRRMQGGLWTLFQTRSTEPEELRKKSRIIYGTTLDAQRRVAAARS